MTTSCQEALHRTLTIEISEYIDYYYNTKRKHSSIDYKNPDRRLKNWSKSSETNFTFFFTTSEALITSRL